MTSNSGIMGEFWVDYQASASDRSAINYRKGSLVWTNGGYFLQLSRLVISGIGKDLHLEDWNGDVYCILF